MKRKTAAMNRPTPTIVITNVLPTSSSEVYSLAMIARTYFEVESVMM